MCIRKKKYKIVYVNNNNINVNSIVFRFKNKYIEKHYLIKDRYYEYYVNKYKYIDSTLSINEIKEYILWCKNRSFRYDKIKGSLYFVKSVVIYNNKFVLLKLLSVDLI